MAFDHLILECSVNLQSRAKVLQVSVPINLINVAIEDYAFLWAHLFKHPIDFPVLELPMSNLKVFHSLCGVEELLLKTHHFFGLGLHALIS